MVKKISWKKNKQNVRETIPRIYFLIAFLCHVFKRETLV